MKAVVMTKEFQDMVAKVIKGSGQEPQLLVTMCMNIEVKKGYLNLTTTDMNNTVNVSSTKVVKECDEDIFTCVNGDTFTKLISKLTSEEITLEMAEGGSVLLVKSGSGKYPFSVYVDTDEVTPVRISTPKFNRDLVGHEIQAVTLKSLLTHNRNCLAKNATNNQLYACYYMDKDGVATFDTIKSCVNNGVKVTSTPILVKPDTVNILDVFTDEKVAVQVDGKYIRFSAGGIEIVSNLVEGASEFPIAPLRDLAVKSSGATLTFNKQNLLNCLDRLMLFIGTQDMYCVSVAFDKKTAVFTGYDDKNICESLTCTAGEVSTPITQLLSLQHLRIQVAACVTDDVKLCFGSDSGLTIEDGNIILFVPYLIADDEEIA